MNIWIFQTGEPLHIDAANWRPMRAMNLADTLVGLGHTVTLWSSSFFHQEKKHRPHKNECYRINESLEIRLIQSCGYKRNISFGRLLDHAQLGINLKKALSNEKIIPDLAFVGYPPIEFALAAINWLNANGVPSMLDAKDQWPHVFVDAFPKIIRPIARIVFSPYYFLGRKVLKGATSFCSMTEGFLCWMSRFSGRAILPSDCVAPLSPLPQQFSKDESDRAVQWWSERGVVESNHERFIFVGSLSRAFDFNPIIEAARYAQENDLNWQFIICGDGDNASRIKKNFAALSNVIFPGWVDRPKIMALAEISTLGLAPYTSTDNFTSNIPNKIIDYLSLGLPIASPLGGEVGRLIQDESVGIRYGQHHADALYVLLTNACADPQTLVAMSKKATMIYRKRFSGEVVYSELVEQLVRLYK